VGRSLSANNFNHLDLEGLGTILPDSLAELPVEPFGEGSADMLLPAALEGTLRRAILDECNTDVYIRTYGETVNQVVTVGSGFALDYHGCHLKGTGGGVNHYLLPSF